ncbi:MAG: threonine/serine exporter family protein [Chloroflexi bacterium]|nr:threonine/serine exporter family protein [Chloroflexota bacterium]MBP7043869.1 threonine/serine exporter family protein [Chloroflexota bacterium]
MKKKQIQPEKTLHQALSSIKSLTSLNVEPKQPIADDEFTPACQFVTQLASHAHEYGVSYIKLQALMSQLPQLFGFHGVMLAASPFIFFEFWRQGDPEPTRATIQSPVGSFDLSKLSALGSLVNDLTDSKIHISEGMDRLKQIENLEPPYKKPVVALGYALCGAGFAVLLSANWSDVVFAALLSLVVYAITLMANQSQWLSNRLNFTSALVASILANVVALLFPGSNPFIVSLCAVIVLIPGLSLTLGTAELASKIVISGVNRLVDGITITFILVMGNAMGSSLVKAIWTVPPADVTPDRPLWITLAFVLVLMLGLTIVFKVGLTDLAWVILAGELAYVGVLFGRQLGDWQGSFVGALILGLYVSLYAFRLRRPGSIVTLPGIMILVPGVAAYFGLNTLQTSGIIGALPAVAGVFTQIVAIMGGLFVAASILPPKSSL